MKTKLAAIALSLSGLAGCERCSGSAAVPSDAGTKAAESENVGSPPLLPRPAFVAAESYRGYGIPTGCRFEGAIEESVLGTGKVRFASPRHVLDSLALARGGAERPEAEAAGAFELDGGAVRLPWGELEAPPLLERTDVGWVAVWAEKRSAASELLLWRGGDRAEKLAEGDQLAVADFGCALAGCAALTTLLRSAAAPGASWFFGFPQRGAASFRRVDIELGGDEPWQPLAVARISAPGDGVAALSSGKHVAFAHVEGGRMTSTKIVEARFGAYDASFADMPLALVPGDRVDRPCGAEEFPLLVLDAEGGTHEIRTPAPPESVVLRPLDHAALAAWVAPVSCQHLERRVVHLALLDRRGIPRSSPMAVADATGFALSTRGDELSLWLRRPDSLVRLRARCPSDTPNPPLSSSAGSPAPPGTPPTDR